MRTIQLHPLSIFVGLVIAALAFVAMGQMPQVMGPLARRPGKPAPIVWARGHLQIRETLPVANGTQVRAAC